MQCHAHFVYAHNRRDPVILNKTVIASCKINILKLIHKGDHTGLKPLESNGFIHFKILTLYLILPYFVFIRSSIKIKNVIKFKILSQYRFKIYRKITIVIKSAFLISASFQLIN